MEKNFTVSATFRSGWMTLKSNWLVLIGLIIGYFFLISLISWPSMLSPDDTMLQLITTLITWVIGLFFSLGYLKMCLDAVDGKEPQFIAFREILPIVFPYLVASILLMFIVIGGMVLLIIPGIYFAIRLSYYPYYMIEGAGTIDSMKKSWALTKGNVWTLVILMFVFIALILLGIVALILGVFVAGVLCNLMVASSYRLMQMDQEANEPTPAVSLNQ